MQLDDFDTYLQAKREELRVTPQTFWPEYLWTLALCIGCALFIMAFAVAAPILRSFFAG